MSRKWETWSSDASKFKPWDQHSHFCFLVIQNCLRFQSTYSPHSNILSDNISAFCLLKILLEPKPRFFMCSFSPLYLQYKYSHLLFLHHIWKREMQKRKDNGVLNPFNSRNRGMKSIKISFQKKMKIVTKTLYYSPYYIQSLCYTITHWIVHQ